MGTFSDKVAIAICDRCSFKYKITELKADGNTPSIRVCEDCRDPIDPYRLTPLKPDAIALAKPRPDTFIGITSNVRQLHWDTQGFTWDSGLSWDETV